MRKQTFLTITICLMTVIYTSAQKSSFQQDDNVVSLAIGIGSTYYSDYDSFDGLWGNRYGYSRMPTFSLAYERCIIENLFDDRSALGIGGVSGYTSTKWNWGRSTDILVGLRGALHYVLVDNLDTYGGVMTGIHIWKYDGKEVGHNSNSEAAYGVFVGGRYYLADNFGVFAEFGYGYTIFNIGIAFKF